MEGTAKLDGIKAICSLAYHGETKFLKHVGQVNPGNGLVVNNDHFFQTVFLHFLKKYKQKLTKPKFCDCF